MNLKCMRLTMVKAAKEQLARHQNLGQRSSLSIIQVAELLDIISGKTKPVLNSPIFSEEVFSLN